MLSCEKSSNQDVTTTESEVAEEESQGSDTTDQSTYDIDSSSDQEETSDYDEESDISGEGQDDSSSTASEPRYITKVFDYMPGVGQEVNSAPEYEQGDTQEAMNSKVLAAIGGNTSDEITLGGYGGYVVVGFDSPITNSAGEYDFRVISSADYRAAYPTSGGNFEPGIVMVSCDSNYNGLPDDEWYEIYGSAHIDPTSHSWYSEAVIAGVETNFYRDYQISYTRPENGSDGYYWEDNKGGSGYRSVYGTEHNYFPAWYDGDTLTLSGSRLPDNGIDISSSSYPIADYMLFRFEWGYADNALYSEDGACINIEWARDASGNAANLTSIDFIKIYTGVNQDCDIRGEVSTKLSAIEVIDNVN